MADVPDPGEVKLGPQDSFYDYACSSGATGTPPGCLPPALSHDSVNNALRMYFGDFNDSRNQATTVDLLFTVTVSDDPFADRLYLTNQVQATEGSTNAGTITSEEIVQIVLTQPVLRTTKGIIWTSNPSNVFDPVPPGPFAFLPPASAPRWRHGLINSTNLAANPIDSDVRGVDAGDTVSFAIAIENTGSSLNGAFDIVLRDDLPDGYVLPVGGPNLQVYYGNGSGPIAYTYPVGGPACTGVWPGDPCGPDGSAGTPDDLFGYGIELIDPVGQGVCSAYDPNLGNNIILVTFDLQLAEDITPGEVINTSSLVRFAGSENGPNHLPTPQTDTATATIEGAAAKELVGTEIDNAVNSSTQGVIGELVTYRLTLTIAEGETPEAQVVDTLDAGLAFVQVDSVTASAGLTIENTIGTGTTPANVTIGGSGNVVTFDLGDVTNANRDNGVAETVEIEYTAVVLNVAGNQSGTLLNNSAVFSWAGGGLAAVSAPVVTVIEPVVAISKTIAPNTGDAGDPFTYTLTVGGATVTDAFDVTLTDGIPVLMENLVLTSVTDTAGLVTLANFDLTGNDLTTVTPWDMPVDAGRQIVLTITGTVSYAASPGQTIDNVATARWTSLPGVVVDRSLYNAASDERTGAGGVDDYFASNPATSARFTVATVARAKYLIATSEAHTTEPVPPYTWPTTSHLPVAVGEVVRYRLVVPLPEGTSTNFQLRDNLPPGLIFVNDGTARAAFVSNGAGITSSPVGTLPVPALVGCTVAGNAADGSLPAGPLPCVLADFNIGNTNSTAVNSDVFGNGTDPYFKLGTLVNNDSDVDAEFVVVEFNALVNNSNNDAGNNRDNTFLVTIGGAQIGGNSNTIRIRTYEPSITNLNKVAVPTTGDAGDVIAYATTFSNAAGANRTTAFDLVLTDPLPVDMTLDLASLNVSSAGDCASGVDTSGSAGNNVLVRIAAIPAGCAVTLTYSATLDASVVPAQVLANTASLTYTSLPGPNGTTLQSNGFEHAVLWRQRGAGRPAG